MKRRIVTVLIILIGFLFQCTVFKTLSIGSISPNLMVIITSSFGFMKGKKEGLWVGFFCGLLEDIFYGRLLGMHAVIYMYIGYANGYFNHISDIGQRTGVRTWALCDHVHDEKPLCIFLLSDEDHIAGAFVYDCCDAAFLQADLRSKPKT